MSEIIKLYENVGIEKRLLCGDRDVLCGHVRPDGKSRLAFGCFGCEYINDSYPPFTAEKQLAIIKLISKQGQVIIENWEKDNRGFNVTFRANSNLRYITMDCITRETVEEALAQIVNDIWQDLTETEQEEIRKILKG